MLGGIHRVAEAGAPKRLPGAREINMDSALSFARFMLVRSAAKRCQSNNRSYQQENHDELGVFNDEGEHGVTYIVSAQHVLHIFFHRVSAGKYRFVCWTNVSCVTDNFSLFIQAASVKSFPPLFTPAGLLAGFFYSEKCSPPRHAFRSVKAIDQKSNVALPGAASRAQSTVDGALGKRFGRF